MQALHNKTSFLEQAQLFDVLVLQSRGKILMSLQWWGARLQADVSGNKRDATLR